MTDKAEVVLRKEPQADYLITLDGRDLSRLIAPNLISLSLSESAPKKPTRSTSC